MQSMYSCIHLYHFFFFFANCFANCQIQSNKQDIGQLQKKLKVDINEYRSIEPTPNRVHSRWNNDEVMLAIQGKVIFGDIKYF